MDALERAHRRGTPNEDVSEDETKEEEQSPKGNKEGQGEAKSFEEIFN